MNSASIDVEKDEKNLAETKLSNSKNDEKKNNHSSEEKNYGECMSLVQQIFSNVETTENAYVNDPFYSYDSQSDRFFNCEKCLLWFSDIEELMVHIVEEHEEIQVSEDSQSILYKQWDDILQVEKSIMELVAAKRLKSAKRYLKTSLSMLNSITTNVFTPKDNIFRYFVSTMRSRIKLIIKESKIINGGKIKKIKNNLLPNINYSSAKLKANKEKKGRKRKKKRAVFDDKDDDEKQNNSSNFSTDDDICLKDAIKQINADESDDIILEEIQSKSQESISDSETCLKENNYYVIPEKEDGNILSLFENNSIKAALKDVLKKREINMTQFEDIILKRFDLEEDEIVPDEAIIIAEWILPETNNDVWDKITFQDFLAKNISRKHKKRKNKFNDQTNSNESKDSTSINVDNVDLEDKHKENHLQGTSNGQKIDKLNCTVCCGISFTYKEQLLQHELQYHSKRLECEVCGFKCSTNEDKDKHFASHKSENGWKCGLCSETFLSVDNLKTHYKHKHCSLKRVQTTPLVTGKVKKFIKDSSDAPECKVCFRRFTSVGRLTQHMDIAHGDKVFVRNGRKKAKIADLIEDVSANIVELKVNA